GCYHWILLRYPLGAAVVRGGAVRPIKILELLLLLMVANGTPLFATRLLGSRWSYPLDGNVLFTDGRRLLGQSKTVRGVVLAIIITAAGSALLGLGWGFGALVGGVAILGELFSRVVKCGVAMPPSRQAAGVHHIPE